MAWIETHETWLGPSAQDNNALECYSFFSGKGWVIDAIAAICGNMAIESSINPDITNRRSGAYGLTQWITHKQDMKDWCTANGYSWASGVGQTNYIEWERLNPAAADQWYGRGDYVGMTFTDFAHNTRGYTVRELTHAFWRCYERSGEYQTERETKALHFYELFGGQPGPGGNFPKWLLFNRKRKWYWQGGDKY